MALLRSGIFSVYLVLITVALAVPASPALIMSENAARAVIRVWCRSVLAGLRVICGVSHRVEGAENIPSGAAVVAANHQSMWETIALYSLLPWPAMVLKKELLRVPVYGWWAKPAGNIVVNREGGAKALRALTRAAAARVAEGGQVVVFPEGTRSDPGERRDFQPGVAGVYRAAGVACTPVAHDSGRFWRHPGILKLPGEITIRFLAPIAPGLDSRTFLSTLQARIEAARPDLENEESPTCCNEAAPAAVCAAGR